MKFIEFIEKRVNIYSERPAAYVCAVFEMCRENLDVDLHLVLPYDRPFKAFPIML